MLPNGALVDERTHSKLGDGALGEVLASLWPGDCQSCGTSLGSGKPALMVDDLQVLTRANLHHHARRLPQWPGSSWRQCAPHLERHQCQRTVTATRPGRRPRVP